MPLPPLHRYYLFIPTGFRNFLKTTGTWNKLEAFQFLIQVTSGTLNSSNAKAISFWKSGDSTVGNNEMVLSDCITGKGRTIQDTLWIECL